MANIHHVYIPFERAMNGLSNECKTYTFMKLLKKNYKGRKKYAFFGISGFFKRILNTEK
jgi:hypothetical protein